MNCMATRLTVMIVVLLATALLWAEQPKADPADEKALRELHQAYVAAFNKGDAKAVAAFYAPDGDLLTSRGEMFKGRAEIEKRTASVFAQNKGIKLKTSGISRHFITPDVVIVDRTGELTAVSEGTPTKAHATTVYVKRDGKWLIASVRLMVPFQPPKP